jgi:1D-myo-inositol 3-kinase
VPSITTSFAAFGHVTNDILEGGLAAGGSALYAALTAAALGCRARVVTSHGPDFVGLEMLARAGVTVEGGGAPRTTTFRNVYREGRREEHVLAIAEPLVVTAAAADVVFACPVIDEVARSLPAGAGAGLQGWLRQLDAGGRVAGKPLGDVGFLRPCRAVFLSDEDEGADVTALRATVPIVVVTHGRDGAEAHEGARTTRIAAHPAREVDPTGAGDVFAAAFLIGLCRGASVADAGALAARMAARVVEDVGPAALRPVVI